MFSISKTAIPTLKHTDVYDFFELSTDVFWLLDVDFKFTQFVGTDPTLKTCLDSCIGRYPWDLPWHNIDPLALTMYKIQLGNHESFSNFRCSCYNSLGFIHHFSVSGKPIYDADDVFIGYRGISRNITDIIEPSFFSHSYESQLNQIIDSMPVAIFALDTQHKVICWNKACEKLTGFSRSQIIGFDNIIRKTYQLDTALADLVLDNVDFSIMHTYFENLEKSKLIDGAYEATRYMPQLDRWLHITSAPLFDINKKISGVIETMQDISDQRRMEQELKILSNKDSLTGVGNRRFFDESLKITWADCCKHAQFLSLLMIDVDYFKLYNDTYGHQAGDLCLQTIATSLTIESMPLSSVVARYGGEEFIILLPNCTDQDAFHIAGNIQNYISSLDISHQHGISGKLTVSIGISTVIPNVDMPMDMLILAADNALYDAKRSGRNCIKFNTY